MPVPGVTWEGLAYAVRTASASLIALYIAFCMNLDDPKWAAITVWIVAQNSRGMSVSKSQYRMLGTALGALAALVLVALFAQTPELFLLGLAGWIGPTFPRQRETNKISLGYLCNSIGGRSNGIPALNASKRKSKE
ncbi:FUSC family protein [Paraburkholderia sp. BR14264]|uniref:FUSC family protein n=1 Tax=Paraburkholderia sp. BR14264 TaxID=3237001 RepID=UPI00397862A5